MAGAGRGGGARRAAAPPWPPGISNYRALATGRARRRALKLLMAGLEAASPREAVRRAGATPGQIAADWCPGSPRSGPIDLSPYRSVKVVAFGKAALGMAAAAREWLGPKVDGGIVVAPAGAPGAAPGRGFRVLRAAHPEPDRSSVEAARAVERYVAHRGGSELLLFLVSGGGSSLLCMPDGVDLGDKARAADLLAAAGAPISEINCVRKHLSRIKGGRLAAGASCDAAALLMSDVPGDDPAVVASGATYGDPTTFADALAAARSRGLSRRMPRPVLERLRDGAAGRVPDTPDGPVIPNAVVATNTDCLEAMESRARGMGYSARTISIGGDVGDAAARVASAWEKLGGGGDACVLFGGETTVRVRRARGGKASGRGGRCQEIVARIVLEIAEGGAAMAAEPAVVAAIGTDGIDGTTPSAGAVAETAGADAAVVRSHIEGSDTGALFEERSTWAVQAGKAAGGRGERAAISGGPVITGQTGTNLCDIGAVVPAGPPPGGPDGAGGEDEDGDGQE